MGTTRLHFGVFARPPRWQVAAEPRGGFLYCRLGGYRGSRERMGHSKRMAGVRDSEESGPPAGCGRDRFTLGERHRLVRIPVDDEKGLRRASRGGEDIEPLAVR